MSDGIDVACSREGSVAVHLTVAQYSRCGVLRNMTACESDGSVVMLDEATYTPEVVQQLCAYLQLPDPLQPDAFLAPLMNDLPAIFALLQAADALECTDLLDLLSDTIVGLAIAQKTVAQCLAAFGLPADTVFTPDEVAAAAADFPFLDMRHVPVLLA